MPQPAEPFSLYAVTFGYFRWGNKANLVGVVEPVAGKKRHLRRNCAAESDMGNVA